MKKLILLTALIFVVAFAAGNATQVRTLTMGDANFILHDENNIWIFPQTLYDYPELMVGEFYEDYESYTEFSDIGIHYKFGEKKPYVLGVYFTQNQPFEIPNYDYYFNYEDNKKIDLFYSRMLGAHKFGFHFNFINGGWRHDIDSNTTEDISMDKSEQSVTSMEFDIGLTPNNGNLDLSAGIGFLSWKDKNAMAEDLTKPKGNLLFGVAARYWYQYNQKITFVPHLGFMYRKEAIEYYADNADLTDLDETDTYKNMSLDLGWGMNYTPAAGVLAIGDIGFLYEKYTDKYEPVGTGVTITENKYTYTSIPYFRIGLEANVLKWVDLRMGGTSYWDNDKDEYLHTGGQTYEYRYHYNYFSSDFYLGAGLHWGNFYADLYVDPMLVTDGPYFLSGNSTDWSYQVSLKYKMF
jgi:hypothetical protein